MPGLTLPKLTQDIIVSKLRNGNATYAELKAILDNACKKSVSDEQAVKILRLISTSLAAKEQKEQKKGYHTMPSTVQSRKCQWNGVEIDIVGFRHGCLSINTETANELKKILNLAGTTDSTILTEDSLNGMLISKGVPVGIDIKDAKKTGWSKLRHVLHATAITLLPITLMVAGGIAATRKATRHNGYHLNYDSYPDYYDTVRLFQMPESIEIDMHKELAPDLADKLDSSFVRSLANHRSAYMAGYIAATAEKTGKPVAMVCGGAHLPRIASCLEFGSRENMPDSLGKHFDKGYAYASRRARLALVEAQHSSPKRLLENYLRRTQKPSRDVFSPSPVQVNGGAAFNEADDSPLDKLDVTDVTRRKETRQRLGAVVY